MYHDPCDIYVGTDLDDRERRHELWKHNKVRGSLCYPSNEDLATGVKATRPIEAENKRRWPWQR